MKPYNAIIVLGPTGSGKTELSLALAWQVRGEIINADSMQVYKHFDIGTAKASKTQLAEIKHHLIDTLNPEQPFTVVDYKKQATDIINKLHAENKTPIIVGGTGFYIDSLLNNLSYGTIGKSAEIREKYNAILEHEGKEKLFSLLKKVDEARAEKLHINDTKRVIRALEIYELQKQNQTTDSHNSKALEDFNPLIIGLTYDRAELYSRINNRVDKMIEAGLVDEAKQIYEEFADKTLQPMTGIGYKELFNHFDGHTSLQFAIDKIKQNTRNYAKRQLTWFKRNADIKWFNKSLIKNDEILSQVLAHFNNKN